MKRTLLIVVLAVWGWSAMPAADGTPPASSSKYDIAALVYPGYHPDPRWQKELGIFHEGIGEWQNVKEAKPKWKGHYQPRKPAWGFENEADPKVMEKKIEVASSHGVNVFIFDWYWYGGRPFLEDALREGFLGAKNNGKMKFFLMWANHNFSDGCNNRVSRKNDRVRLSGAVNADEFRAMSKRIIDLFLSRPNYYRIGGKPVFMIYEPSSFVDGMGGMENAAAALRRFDDDCKAAGLGGVHLMACSWGKCRPEHVAALGIESATMYTYAHHVRPRGDYASWAAKGLAKLDSEKTRLAGLKAYFGHVSVGWDTNPRYPETLKDVVNSTPTDFEKALRRAKDWCDRNTPPGYPKLISINAWNEWIEGSYLEPDEKYGMGYLEAIQNVFASAIDRSAMSDEYWAIWNDAEQARIDADIEANRKADASVAIDAPDGTEVRYEQLTHDFRFGASTFNFGQLGSPELNRRYEAAFGEGGVFNQGTVPFYWREYEPVPGVIRAFDGEASTEEYWNALPRAKALKERFWRRPPPGKVIDFLKGKGLRVHGHILVTGGLRPEWLYDRFCPEKEKEYLEKLGLPRRETYKATGKEWEFAQFRGFCAKKLYPKMSEQEIAAALPGWTGAMRRLWTQRVLDIGALFGGKADSWDVVNESSKDFVPYGKSRTGLPVWKSFKGIMPGDFPLVALLDAKRAFPATTELAINDNNINDDFLKQVKDLTAEGARIDLVGCQMHIMKDSYMQSLAAGKKHVNWVGTPKTIRDRLDMMARTGRRIHISEITIPQAGSGEKGLAIQAIAVRNLYRIWFSHKAVAGITWWNLVDGCSFPGEPQISGLFTREMRPKPAYNVLNALVNGEWKSKGTVPAKGGKIAFRGFRGRYRLSWKDAAGKTVAKTVEVK